jgi:hypothetical protein
MNFSHFHSKVDLDSLKHKLAKMKYQIDLALLERMTDKKRNDLKDRLKLFAKKFLKEL